MLLAGCSAEVASTSASAPKPQAKCTYTTARTDLCPPDSLMTSTCDLPQSLATEPIDVAVPPYNCWQETNDDGLTWCCRPVTTIVIACRDDRTFRLVVGGRGVYGDKIPCGVTLDVPANEQCTIISSDGQERDCTASCVTGADATIQAP